MTDSPPAAGRYANLEELELQHNALLYDLDKACASETVASDSESERRFVEANLDRIRSFVENGARTGAVLHGLNERRPAQQMLDRWAACLFRVGIRNGPRATLLPFDENAAPELDEALRPYVGLDAFNEDENTLFRGRDDRVADLAEAVRTRTFVFVTGASGSGKSSLVRAGLLPALKRDTARGTDRWTILPTLIPGATPLRNLARELAATFEGLDENALRLELAADPQRLRVLLDERVATTCLIVIDQFEEVFTLRSSPDNDSPAFIAALVALAQSPGCRHRIVATFRKDREGDLAAYADLQQIYFDRPFIVSSMRPDQLREAIVQPAAEAGLVIEDDVVDALVNTFSGDETGLPLLQYCLVELWERRKRNRVTAHTLADLGDPKLAMAKVADEIYQPLSLQGKEAVKHIFLALAQKVEGHEFLRTRKTRAELWSLVGNKTTADDIVERFAARRLLKVSPAATGRPEDDILEVAHEALLRNWTEFRKWVVEEGARIDQRMFVSRQAALWADSAGKADDASRQDATGLLLSGIALSQAMADLYKEYPEGSIERRFLDASQRKSSWVEGELTRAAEAARKEAAWERENAARRRRWYVAGLLGTLIALGGAVGWVIKERVDDANDRIRNVATAAREKCETDSNLSRKLALHALEQADASEPARTADAVSAVYCLMRASWKQVTQTPLTGVVAFALSGDGKRVLIADVNGNLREQSTARAAAPEAGFRLETSELWSDPDVLPISVMAYSPDGDFAVVGMRGAGADRGESGYCPPGEVCGGLVLVARSSGKATVVARARTGAVSHVAFSRDGTQIAIVSARDDAGQRPRLRIFDRAQVARDGSFDKPTFDDEKIDDAIAKLGASVGPRAFAYITTRDRAFEVQGEGRLWIRSRLRYPECEMAATLSAGASRRVLAQPSRTCVFAGGQLDRPMLVDESNVVYAALRGNDDVLITLVPVKGGGADLVMRSLAPGHGTFVLPRIVEAWDGCAPDPMRAAPCQNFDALIQVADDGRTIAVKSAPTEIVVHHVVEDTVGPLSGLSALASDVVFAADDSHFATVRAVDPANPKAFEYAVYEVPAARVKAGAAGEPTRKPQTARLTAEPQTMLTVVDETGGYFALQDPSAAWTTVYKVDGQEARQVATLEGATAMPAFGGYKVIVRQKEIATACELYRLASADTPVWRYQGVHVSCEISDDGQVAMLATAGAGGAVTLMVQATAGGAKDAFARLPVRSAEARYMLVGGAAKYVLVAEPAPAAKGGAVATAQSRVTIYAWRDGQLVRTGEFDAPVDVQVFAARVFELDPSGDTLVATESAAHAALRSIKDPGKPQPDPRQFAVEAFDPLGRYGIRPRAREAGAGARDSDSLPNLDLDPSTQATVTAKGKVALSLQRNRAAVYDIARGSKFADVPFAVQRAELSPRATHLVVGTQEGVWVLPTDAARLKSLLVRGGADDELDASERCRYVERGDRCD